MTPFVEVLDSQGSCLVVNKPPGLATQAPPGLDSMEERVRAYWQATDGKSYRVYVGVPHRLDRPASGALIFARNRRATQRLARQFAQREVDKTYLALIEGCPAEENGTWMDFVCKDADRAHVRVLPSDDPGALSAELSYRVVQQLPPMTLVEVTPRTGRTHQIRVQFASRGFPIVGDRQYGATRDFGSPVDEPRSRPIALHARRIRFRHPTMPHFVTVTAPLPAVWDTYGLQTATD